MNRRDLIKHLKGLVPSLHIEKSDGLGTRHSPHYLHCVVCKEDVLILEKAAADIGKKAIWPICSAIYGHHRVIRLF